MEVEQYINKRRWQALASNPKLQENAPIPLNKILLSGDLRLIPWEDEINNWTEEEATNSKNS